MTFSQQLRRSSGIIGKGTKFLKASKLPMNARCFSSSIRGQDLLEDSLAFGKKRKIILDSYYHNTGVDVHGMLELPLSDEEDLNNTMLMNGSILAFPFGCYLWKPRSVKEVTLESLSMVLLSKPAVEFLFIGCDELLPPREMKRIKTAMKKKHIVVEQMNVMNAMGTFNVLNGEDRRIAVAIVVGDEDTQNLSSATFCCSN
jgi:uncharacterized protein